MVHSTQIGLYTWDFLLHVSLQFQHGKNILPQKKMKLGIVIKVMVVIFSLMIASYFYIELLRNNLRDNSYF